MDKILNMTVPAHDDMGIVAGFTSGGGAQDSGITTNSPGVGLGQSKPRL